MRLATFRRAEDLLVDVVAVFSRHRATQANHRQSVMRPTETTQWRLSPNHWLPDQNSRGVGYLAEVEVSAVDLTSDQFIADKCEP